MSRHDRAIGAGRVWRRRTAAIGIVGGMFVAMSLFFAGNANATIGPVQTMHGRAFTITVAEASGGHNSYLVGPLVDTGRVSTNNSGTVTPPCSNLLGVVSAVNLCDSVTTVAPADVTATSSMDSATLSLFGLPLITVGGVSVTSETTCSGSWGSTTIGYLSVAGHVVINSPTVVPPNLGVSVGPFSIVLNQQMSTALVPGMRVNAVHAAIKVGGATDYISIGHAETRISKCPA